MLWRADPPRARRLVALDGLSLIYHRPSGMTHVVAPPMPEILDALGEGPADVADIVSRLAARFDIADPADAEAVVSARLAELAERGLVFAA